MKFNKCTTDCLRLKTTSEGFSQCFGSMKMTEFDLKELNLLITLSVKKYSSVTYNVS